jgi:zinc/manganese transport system substrate-binding protein
MRSHHHSTLRAFAMGMALCMVFGTASCFGNTSSDESDSTQSSSTEQTEPIEVVASVNQWGSLAEQIGGDYVNVSSILSSTGVDAHGFEPSTSDMASLQKAQVVVSNGAGYDAWATKNIQKGMVSVSAAQMVGAAEGDNPHLWFSNDARNAMAKELADTYSRIMPSRKKYFTKKLASWQKGEDKVEQAMKSFSDKHSDAAYAATESVAYYLLSDMGVEDKTPEGYLQSAASESEPAPADLQEFQELLEKHKVDVLVNNAQASSDSTNMLTGTANKSELPVFDVTEQMPSDQESLTAWICSLVESLTTLFDEQSESASSDESGDASSESSDDSGTSSDSTSDAAQPDPGK